MAQKFYKKASVQVAIVVGIVTIIVTGATIWHQRSELYRDNQRLQQQLDNRESEIQDLKAERDNLDIKMTVFQAAADKAFPDSKKEERLDLLINLLEQIGKDLAKVVPFRLSEAQRKIIFAQISLAVQTEKNLTNAPPSIHLLKFPGQTDDAAELMDLLQLAFYSAGRKSETHTNLAVKGLKLDGKPWSGVVVSVNDLENPPFVAEAVFKLLTDQGLRVYSREGSGYGQNAVVIWAHRLAYSATEAKNKL